MEYYVGWVCGWFSGFSKIISLILLKTGKHSDFHLWSASSSVVSFPLSGIKCDMLNSKN